MFKEPQCNDQKKEKKNKPRLYNLLQTMWIEHRTSIPYTLDIWDLSQYKARGFISQGTKKKKVAYNLKDAFILFISRTSYPLSKWFDML